MVTGLGSPDENDSRRGETPPSLALDRSSSRCCPSTRRRSTTLDVDDLVLTRTSTDQGHCDPGSCNNGLHEVLCTVGQTFIRTRKLVLEVQIVYSVHSDL